MMGGDWCQCGRPDSQIYSQDIMKASSHATVDCEDWRWFRYHGPRLTSAGLMQELLAKS
jgi:hypothetical protein